jgi:hypothetical protein
MYSKAAGTFIFSGAKVNMPAIPHIAGFEIRIVEMKIVYVY